MGGLGVFFTEDIAYILAALASAGAHHGPMYLKALGDVALALGVRLPMSLVFPTSLTIEGVYDEWQAVGD